MVCLDQHLLSGSESSVFRKFMIIFFFPCRPNFLIMDEPTNHLDMETVDALAKALERFKVIVTVIMLVSSITYLCVCVSYCIY